MRNVFAFVRCRPHTLHRNALICGRRLLCSRLNVRYVEHDASEFLLSVVLLFALHAIDLNVAIITKELDFSSALDLE